MKKQIANYLRTVVFACILLSVCFAIVNYTYTVVEGIDANLSMVVMTLVYAAAVIFHLLILIMPRGLDDPESPVVVKIGAVISVVFNAGLTFANYTGVINEDVNIDVLMIITNIVTGLIVFSNLLMMKRSGESVGHQISRNL